MSGRIRTVKPEWIEDERFTACSDSAVRMAFVLLSLVDDDGRCRISPRALGLAGWKFCDRIVDKTGHAIDAANELIESSWLIRYEVDGYDHWQIRNFSKHQKIDKYRASKLPAPPCSANSREESRGVARSPDDSTNRETISESSNSTNGREESRMVAVDLDQGSGSWIVDLGSARETKATNQVEHADVVELYSRLRAEAHQAKHGRPGGRYVRGPKDWQPVEDLVAFARASGGLSALEDSLRGYLADEWATGAGWPLSTWAKDPGRYQGLGGRPEASNASDRLRTLLAQQRALSDRLRAANDRAERCPLDERDQAEAEAEAARNAKVAVDRAIRAIEDQQRRGAA